MNKFLSDQNYNQLNRQIIEAEKLSKTQIGSFGGSSFSGGGGASASW